MVGEDQRHCSTPCRAQDTPPQRVIQRQTPTVWSPRAAVRHTTIAIQAESCCAPSSPPCLLGPGPFPWRASNHRTPNWADLHFLNSFSRDHEGFSDLLWLSRPSRVVFDLQETWHFSCTDATKPAPREPRCSVPRHQGHAHLTAWARWPQHRYVVLARYRSMLPWYLGLALTR